MPMTVIPTDSEEFKALIGNDATATFEDDPNFVDANPTANASTESVEVQRDTDDLEESDEEVEDADEEDEVDEDEALEDEDDDDDDDDDEGDVEEGVDDDDEDDDLDTDAVTA